MKKSIFISVFSLLATSLFAQFDGDGGTSGSKAISKDDKSIIAWANGLELSRDNTVTYGKVYDALGVADTTNLVCVSLGNRGVAIATFDRPIINGEGFDFVVFENAFDSTFMELAFVEVSSNGIDYFRFPTKTSSTEEKATQTTSHYYNLAGKYSYKYGVGFDLSELEDNALLDKNDIRFVRLIDVFGGEDKTTEGDIIWEYNELYWLGSSGFDLSGIGIINGGEKYKIADMEGILQEEDTYELASSTNFDESITDNLKHKNYKSGNLLFKGVTVIGDGYEMAIGWGPSNVSDTSKMKATTISGFGWNNDYYVSAYMSGIDGENTGYLHGYYSSYNTEEHNTVTTTDGKEFEPLGVYVCQSLSSYIYEPATPQADLYFKIVAEGFDSEGKSTGKQEVYLRDGSDTTIGNRADWRYMNLAQLGKVQKIQFSVESNDATYYIPAYMCIDNLTYKQSIDSDLENISEKDITAKINIYPNPSCGDVTIENVTNTNIRIFDIQGRIIYNKKSSDNTVAISNLPSGTYFVSIISNENVVTTKLIIK